MNKLNSCLTALVCVFAVVSSAHSNEDLLELCEPYEIIGGPHAGVYHGWFYPNGNKMRQTLIVIEETDAGNVVARWAHGKQPKWGVNKKACHWISGRYAENKMEVEAHGKKMIYNFNEDGKVKAVFITKTRVKGKLTKANND